MKANTATTSSQMVTSHFWNKHRASLAAYHVREYDRAAPESDARGSSNFFRNSFAARVHVGDHDVAAILEQMFDQTASDTTRASCHDSALALIRHADHAIETEKDEKKESGA